MMQIQITTPTGKVVETKDVSKVIAEAQNGHFCLLPHHIDFVSALVPGILTFRTDTGKPVFIAVSEGVLVKIGSRVLVSVREAIQGPQLADLKKRVQEELGTLNERERVTRSAIARLEANFVRRFLEFGEAGGP